jgi:hypothetical protein
MLASRTGVHFRGRQSLAVLVWACLVLLTPAAPPAGVAAAAPAAIQGRAPDAAPPRASDTAPDAARLVAAYNERDFGRRGWRQVRLELKQGATTSRTFLVVNSWLRTPEGVRTLFLLREPHSLAGTSYLLVERRQVRPAIEVYLYLPSGRRNVLTVQPSRFDEGLLGSDFSYRDLRFQIPVAGYRFRAAGSRRMGGRPVYAVDAEPADGEAAQTSAWARVRYYLAQDAPLLLGADYFAAGARSAGKRLRVLAHQQVDGAWTETRMVMHAAGGRSSVLTLQNFVPTLGGIADDIFDPGALPEAQVRMPLAADETTE